MVRPGAQEQQSARRFGCPRALSRSRHSAHGPAQFQFFGVLVSLSPPPRMYRSILKGPGECVARDFRAGPSFLTAGAGVRLCGKRPRRSSLRRADLVADVGSNAWSGPAAAQPPSRAWGGEGRGRRSSETWRELSGDVPELLAGEVRERCLLPLGDCPDPVGVWLRFCRPFRVFEWPRGRALLGSGGGSSCLRQDLPAPSLSRAVGYVESIRSGLPRAPAPTIPRALGARPVWLSGSALGGVARRARGGREGHRRQADVGVEGKTEERRSRFTRPQRGAVPPRHHGPG